MLLRGMYRVTHVYIYEKSVMDYWLETDVVVMLLVNNSHEDHEDSSLSREMIRDELLDKLLASDLFVPNGMQLCCDRFPFDTISPSLFVVDFRCCCYFIDNVLLFPVSFTRTQATSTNSYYYLVWSHSHMPVDIVHDRFTFPVIAL